MVNSGVQMRGSRWKAPAVVGEAARVGAWIVNVCGTAADGLGMSNEVAG